MEEESRALDVDRDTAHSGSRPFHLTHAESSVHGREEGMECDDPLCSI